VRVVRSPRRRHTISAQMVGDQVEVRLPATISAEDEARYVAQILDRFRRRRTQRALNAQARLRERAQELSQQYFGGRLCPTDVRYVTTQSHSFGSCSPHRGTIRLSHRLTQMPAWVRDYVLVHELAHLLHPDHSDAFWRLVGRYPLAERARGYLMAAGLEPAGEGTAGAGGCVLELLAEEGS